MIKLIYQEDYPVFEYRKYSYMFLNLFDKISKQTATCFQVAPNFTQNRGSLDADLK